MHLKFAVLIYASVYFFAHYVILSVVKKLFLTSEYVPAFGGDNEFPGDYTEEETPDPIPNSEAKLFRPMVVLTGESRSSPGIIKAGCENSRPFPLRFILTQNSALKTYH